MLTKKKRGHGKKGPQSSDSSFDVSPSPSVSSSPLDNSDQFRIKYKYDASVAMKCKYEVICQDAIQWLQSVQTVDVSGDSSPVKMENDGENLNVESSHHCWKSGTFVVTSLPDYTEIGMDVERWKIWFMDAVTLILEKLPENSCAIFYQTDAKVLRKETVQVPLADLVMERKRKKLDKKSMKKQSSSGANGELKEEEATEEDVKAESDDAREEEEAGTNKSDEVNSSIPQQQTATAAKTTATRTISRSLCTEWVDKTRLCFLGAENTRNNNIKLLWHKIMLRAPIGTVLMAHPGYSHMICFGKGKNVFDNISKRPLPDVLDRGDMLYPKAMGINACMLAMIFCKEAGATTIVDPFCGKGSVLLAANYVGLDAIGVDISATRCRNAKSMRQHSMEDFVKCVQTRSFMRLN